MATSKRAARKQQKERGRMGRQKRLALAKTGRGEPAHSATRLTLPSPVAAERILHEFGGSIGPIRVSDDAAFHAQQIAYDAMEENDPVAALELAGKAVALDPACLDAQTLIATLIAETDEDLIERMHEVVAIGGQSLGTRFIKENCGNFWGILETRPYMRARAMLAGLLVTAGHLEEGIAEYEELLNLNPNDNQGNRDLLLTCYLQVGDFVAARRLIKRYDDECAVFMWGSVLERRLAQDELGADAALRKARESNRFAEAYLTGRKPLPGELPDFYGFGDKNEGIFCAYTLAPAWKRHPDELAWLKQCT